MIPSSNFLALISFSKASLLSYFLASFRSSNLTFTSFTTYALRLKLSLLSPLKMLLLAIDGTNVIPIAIMKYNAIITFVAFFAKNCLNSKLNTVLKFFIITYLPVL